MICLPIMAATNAEARAILTAAADEPADLYEWRIDGLEEPADIAGFLAAANKPVLATCRSSAQGGSFRGSAAERAAVLQRALDAGAQYVDAEEDVIHLLQRREGVTVIASWHDFASTPENLDEVASRLSALPCDWIKFAVMANKPSDNLTVLKTLSACEKPAVGIAMGEIGLPSRILGPAYGSRITFGTLSSGRESAPGQPTARELADVYRVGRLSRDTAVYGLLGDPVRHSIGYRIHNLGFAALGIDAVYLPFQCPETKDFFDSIPGGVNLQGLSVTMPHKQAAFAWAGSVSQAAKLVGAANTLCREKNGWRADNTDFPAVAGAVADAARTNGIVLSGQKALVLGVGGAAKAVGAALASLECAVFVSGRDAAKTGRFAEAAGWNPVSWEDRGRGDWLVVANASPVGMYPEVDATPYPGDEWKRGQVAFDSVYRPRETRFLREAAGAGAVTVDGVEMFVRQAAEQFALWTGRTLPRECGLLAENLAREE